MSNKTTGPLIQIEDLKKYFFMNTSLLDKLDPNTEQKKVHAVDGVNLEVNEGDVLGLVGESGCGKSTLARTMIRLIEPTSGRIRIDGEDITEYSKSQLRNFRRKVQLIHQDPSASLNPRHTVVRLVRDPMSYHKIGSSREDRNDRVAELLQQVGLESEFLNKYPHELSGGQRQRVAIARALSLDPKIIVADEPSSTLDASVQARILNLLQTLQTEKELTMVYISHDLSVVNFIADEVAVMYLGEVVEKGETTEIMNNPKHPYTEALISSVPVPSPSTTHSRIRLEGNVPSPIDIPRGCRFHTRCPKQIPPEDWNLSQDAWLGYSDIKQTINEYLDKSRGQESHEELLQHINEYINTMSGGELSNGVSNVLRTAKEHIADNDYEEAYETLHSEFASPCEETPPKRLTISGGHEVLCHLYDDQIVDAVSESVNGDGMTTNWGNQ